MNKVCVGKIVGAHGIKGQLKLKSYTENAEDIFNFNTLYTKYEKVVKIEKKGTQHSNFIVSISGVSDRNQAEEILGTELKRSITRNRS
jgi:16S rRNA processing protein RimM